MLIRQLPLRTMAQQQVKARVGLMVNLPQLCVRYWEPSFQQCTLTVAETIVLLVFAAVAQLE